jgi:protein involved in ribonucleotide reduction
MNVEDDILSLRDRKNFGEMYRATAQKQSKKSSIPKGKIRRDEDVSTPRDRKNFGEMYRATAQKQSKKSSNLKGMMPGEQDVEQVEAVGMMPGEQDVEQVEAVGMMPGEQDVEQVEAVGMMPGEHDVSTPRDGKNFGEMYRATAYKQSKESSNLKEKMPGEQDVEQVEAVGMMPGEE